MYDGTMNRSTIPPALGPRIPVPTGNFVILDFEATCSDKNEFSRSEMEIIEIGAVAYDDDLNYLESFSSFVAPVRNPLLTDFCKELTTITQADVDAAEPFYQVASGLSLWAAELEISWWGSWGDYDRKQLTQDVRYHRVPDPLPQPHFNIKEGFSSRQGLKKRLGCAGAVKLAGLEFEGTLHRGVDDATMMGKLLPFILGDQRVPSRDYPASSVEERRK